MSRVLLQALLWIAFALSAACEKNSAPELDVSMLLGNDSVDGYQRAIEAREFSFPADHGAHNGFRNEWWYFTGNLKDDRGHVFGYQVTFFRIALSPERLERQSAWAGNQVWMAHVALSDIDARRHSHAQRFARGANGLAGAEENPLRVWLEDWQVSAADGEGFPWTINVQSDAFSLDLVLNADKAPVLQGDKGLSRKSAEPGNASYYYSITRMSTHGTISQAGERFEVTGQSWLDREWSTSALSAEQAGWDWFSLQLDDGRDLMFYRLRNTSGEADVYSAGTLVKVDGDYTTLSRDDVSLEVMDTWRSTTGKDYPVAWKLTLRGEPDSWIVRAAFEDQEMQTAVNYWEGAVEVSNATTGESLGRGYLELTGY
ncbi:MAG: carotenoid 1,2-hydratase [Gammaproteobacteria bacterium]|nr:carotenoid 1,2-hydratase [Gammaproteobacteria bacterium]